MRLNKNCMIKSASATNSVITLDFDLRSWIAKMVGFIIFTIFYQLNQAFFKLELLKVILGN